MSDAKLAPGVGDRISERISVGVARLSKTNPKFGAKVAIGLGKTLGGDSVGQVLANLKRSDADAVGPFTAAAVAAGSKHVEVVKDHVRRQFKRGDFHAAIKFEEVTKKTRAFRRLASLARSNLQLLNEGFPLPPRAATPPEVEHSRRVLYLLHNALPYDSGGYATRAQGIMQGVDKQGYRIGAVTRLGYPSDRQKNLDGVVIQDRYEVDGIDYFNFNDEQRGLGRDNLTIYMQQNIDAIEPLARAEHATILHAASNFMNGVSANYIARKLGVSSVYEVRGLWEITRRSREPDYVTSDAYKQYVRMEAEACNYADQVLTITGALKDELINRGVPGDRITIAPNGVNSERFQPRPKNFALMRELGLAEDEMIVGYIGSIVDYEGLDLLLQALHDIKANENLKWRCIIVGDGDVLASLQEQTTRLNLNDRVIFTGRVPHEQVEEYYSIIDIVPFPRKGLLVCEMVSALKPFEAMAMGKCILASNVAAMQEFIFDGVNGFLFQKDDYRSLAKAMTDMMRTPDRIRDVGVSARRWVVQERDWGQISKTIATVYERVLEERKARDR